MKLDIWVFPVLFLAGLHVVVDDLAVFTMDHDRHF